MSKLESTVVSLAEKFARDVVDALRSVSLAEILGSRTGGATTRAPAARVARAASKPARATTSPSARPASGGVSADAIVAILRGHKGGMRAEELRREVGAAKHTFNYHVSKALAAKQIKKSGIKRSTTYSIR